MDRLTSALALPLLAMFVLLAIVALTGVTASPPSPRAATFSLDLIADRASAEPNGSIAFMLYLNVSGGGPLQLVRVNFTAETDFSVQAAKASWPADCAPISSNASFAEWQCTFLRSGRSYRWTVPVRVADNASIGRYRTATAAAIELGGSGATPRVSQTSVWIVPAILRVTVESSHESAVRLGDRIEIRINVTNVNNTQVPSEIANMTAYEVILTIGLSPGLELDPGTPFRYVDPGLSPQSSISVISNVTVGGGLQTGGSAWINATVVYRDVGNHSVGPKVAQLDFEILSVSPLPPSWSTILLVGAFALLAIVASVTLVPALGERKVALDEVFLMHRSGILIQHLSHGQGLRKDDDLVASMFVAIQEFVRDSFDTKATLDELSFSGRKAAVLRGQHIVLAALMSKGSPRYLFPQMKAVERAIEKAHGESLVDWDGRVSRLDQARPILQAFLRGGFRRYRGWRRR